MAARNVPKWFESDSPGAIGGNVEHPANPVGRRLRRP